MFRPIGMFDFLMYGYIRDKMISLGLKEVWLGGNDEDNEGKLLMYTVRVYLLVRWCYYYQRRN